MLYLALPRYVERVWGSLKRSELTSPAGEVWWVYHDDSGSTELRDPFEGSSTSVADLVESKNLQGHPVYPLLVKTLHTADRLSVQVHPGLSGGGLFKEETWIVLSAEPGSWMMGGLKVRTSEEFSQRLNTGEVEEVVRRIELSGGDVYHIPPGTVHSLGPGLEILEVQSNCDVTYRLYDWGRTGMNGKLRELHLEEGLEAVDWKSGGSPVKVGAGGSLDENVLKADYSIEVLSREGEVLIPPGGLFFLESGVLELNGTRGGPCCLLADGGGGSFTLSGRGYLIKTGGAE